MLIKKPSACYALLCLICFSGLFTAGYCDREAPSTVQVFYDSTGNYKVVSTPQAAYNAPDKGVTKIFRKTGGNWRQVCSQEWYSRAIFVTRIDTSVAYVRFAAWHRIDTINANSLELGFYKNCREIKTYRVIDIAQDMNNIQKSVSHYRVIKETNGFQKISTGGREITVFSIVTFDNREMLFNMADGRVVTIAQDRLHPPAGTANAVTSNDTAAICQAVLDFKTVQWVFHPETPDRLPVRLSDNLIGSRFAFSKFGKTVTVKPDSSLRNLPHFRFDKISIIKDSAFVEFEYKKEGAVGNARLAKSKDNTWKVLEGSVAER